MCILFIYTNPNPNRGKYQLILATNRDEYFDRPAQSAHKWPEDEYIFAGKDLEPGREGGTWFGTSSRPGNNYRLRAAALLNVTGERRQSGATGRGRIVTDYLRGDLPAEDYIQQHLRPNAHTFNAFSFVAVEIGNLSPKIYHYSNVSKETLVYGGESSAPAPTVISFGNSPPSEPLAKVLAGQRRFTDLILGPNSLDDVSQEAALTQELRSLLRWKQQHLPDLVLSRRAPNTVESLSSVYVQVPVARYGTRTHTLLLVDFQGRVDVSEETMECPPPQKIEEAQWTISTHRLHL